MSTFPLYNTLSIDIPDKDLNISQKKNLLKKIEDLDHDTIELIYALICYHQEQYKDGDNYIIPYQGKYLNETDIRFDLDIFPNKLKQIIWKFVNIHLNHT